MKGYKQLFREHANQDLEPCFDMLIRANLKPQRNIEGFFTEGGTKEFCILRLNSNF